MRKDMHEELSDLHDGLDEVVMCTRVQLEWNFVHGTHRKAETTEKASDYLDLP